MTKLVGYFYKGSKTKSDTLDVFKLNEATGARSLVETIEVLSKREARAVCKGMGVEAYNF